MSTDPAHLPVIAPNPNVDHSQHKLGKLPPKHDVRTLHLGDYIARTAIPPAPATRSWIYPGTVFPMMLNDRIGDCTCASAGHMVEAWTRASAGHAVVVPDQAILTAYEAVSGYNPNTGANDNGAVILDVMNYWRNHGIGGHRIMAFAAVPPGDQTMCRQAINLMGGLNIGVNLPLSAQQQDVWDVPPGGEWGPGAPGSWGGHCVPVLAYDSTYMYCITWGSIKKLTYGFFQLYCDEAFCCLSHDWFNAKNKAPSGFNLAALTADLSQL